MAEIPYACLYRSYEKELEMLTPAQVGRLLLGLLHYLNTGEEPKLRTPESVLWPRLREQHLRDAEHYQELCKRNSSNGKKGAAARWNKPREEDGGAIGGHSPAILPMAVMAKEKEREKEKEKEREKEKHTHIECEVGVSYPSKEEVHIFCNEQGLSYVDAERFVSYYASVGWLINGQTIRDWKAAARLWNQRERSKTAHQGGTYGSESITNETTYGTVV